jgi:hypothetical protein
MDSTTQIGEELNLLEKYYFFERATGEATPAGYIDSNTWRGFLSIPKMEGVPSAALKSAFTFLTDRLKPFVNATADLSHLTREAFDSFHIGEVEELYRFLRTCTRGARVQPRAEGEFHGLAYNSYCKVVNLAHTHWCFRRVLCQYQTAYAFRLRHCLHVPLDMKVLNGVHGMITRGILRDPGILIPHGQCAGMGSVKSKKHYQDIQDFLRCEADKIASASFRGSKVSPLAFEGFWQQSPI